MDSKLYEARRNELIDLLKETLKIDELNKDTRENLEKIRRKSVENNFEICLTGEFQGGKSTTFNMLCDGRDISPRGKNGGGIKTSACIISAMNLADDSAPEIAEISWRNSEELLKGSYEIIMPFLHKNHDKRFPLSMGFEGLSKEFKLDRNEDLQLAEDALRDYWQHKKWGNDDQKLDLLQISTLQIRFYNKGFKDLNQKSTKVDDLQNIVTFPENWQELWTQGFDAPFEFSEIRFTYIARVLVRLHSQNLKRLGCVITDAPGLFASKWDSELADQAMNRADAIWYLASGARQMSDGDIKAIKSIIESGHGKKLFFTINGKQNTFKNITTKFIPSNIALLENKANIKAQPESMMFYDAFLAFKSGQGINIFENRKQFDARSKNILLEEGKESEFDDQNPSGIWKSQVKRQLEILEYPKRDKFVGLDQPSINYITEISAKNNVLNTIEGSVLPKKFESILIDCGADPAAEALVEFELELKNIENSAKITKDEHEKKIKENNEKFSIFKSESTEIIDKYLNNNSVDKSIAFELYNFVKTESIKNTSDECAEKLIKEVFTADKILSALNPFSKVTKKDLEIEAKSIMEGVFNQKTKNSATKYLNIIKSGESAAYESGIKTKVELVSEVIRNKYELIADDLMLPHDVFKLSGEFEKDCKILNADKDSIAIGMNAQSIDLGIIMAGLITAICGIIAVCMSHPGGWIAILVGLIAFIFIDGDEKISSKLSDKLKISLDNSLNDPTISAKAVNEISQHTSKFRVFYKVAFEGKLNSQADLLSARVEQARKDHMQSTAVLQEKAAWSEKARTEKIEPIRRKINAFKDAVKKDLGK